MADFSALRRRFLFVMFGGTVAALGAGAALVVSRFLAPIAGEIMSMLAGHASELTAANPTKTVKLGMKDVMLVRTGDSIAAFDMKCTHAGCTVHWVAEKNVFRCPCHGGVYSAAGAVLDGPPPRPLAKLRVNVNAAGEITVTDLPA